MLKRTLIVILFFLFFGLAAFLYGLYKSFVCSNEEIFQKVIPKLCSDKLHRQIFYPHDGNPEGGLSICSLMCDSPERLNISCLSHHLSKAAVFVVTLPSQNIVMKSTFQEEEEEVYWAQNSEMPFIPSESEFNDLIKAHIGYTFGKHDLENQWSTINTSLYENEHQLTLHRTFWQFVKNQEFLFSYIFERLRIFPKILGTCGTFYGSEYAKPLLVNHLYMPKNTKILLSIHLVKYIEKINSVWDEAFHLCDMKVDHFGWTSDGNVLFLDLDSVETDSSLTQIFVNSEDCTSNEDCFYFDCQSQCLASKKCSRTRMNTNLQVLCDKIFLGISDVSYLSQSLFSSSGSSELLQEALHLCSTNPGMTVDALIEVLKRETLSELHHSEI